MANSCICVSLGQVVHRTGRTDLGAAVTISVVFIILAFALGHILGVAMCDEGDTDCQSLTSMMTM